MIVSSIWRHPIKSHGREQLDDIQLTAGQTMPKDREWAVAHEAARVDPNKPGWAPCANFSRAAKAPALMAIEAISGNDGRVTLAHPDRPSITFDPDDNQEAAEFIQWVTPLCPPDRARPKMIYKVPGRGMTDSDFPSVSINSTASLNALSQVVGSDVSALRFRGNIWIDGMKPWEEFDLVGKEIGIGQARLKIVEPIERCMATTANPETGRRDLETLKILEENWGHLNFGVRAEVIADGRIKVGDELFL